ncbi:MAG TPA: putative glycolipid-binding domain-containing protein [Geodermatophilus sp.]|nr:putative glycolipid-binding domain-containing protein [Geodermatophilus sp.]
METRVVAWRRTDEDAGHSLARVGRRGGGWLFHGTEVLAGPGTLLACSFRVEVDDAWATRAVEVSAVDAEGERRLVLTADADRRWARDGEPVPGLDGCVDVDVAATPLTNTLPIRRLASLAVGEEVTTPVAWVDVPALGVTRVDQTYRRLGPRRWRYSDEAHGAFELTVDDDGLVVDYTGMATRVAG